MSYTYTKEKDSFTAIQNLVGGSLAGRSDGSKMSYDDGQKAPTQAEIDAELKRLQDEYDANEYQRSRASEYPSITDVVVALAEKEEGDSTMWDDITAKRQAVKTKYKKG